MRVPHAFSLAQELIRRHQRYLVPYIAHVTDHLGHAQYELIFERCPSRVRQIRLLGFVRIDVI